MLPAGGFQEALDTAESHGRTVSSDLQRGPGLFVKAWLPRWGWRRVDWPPGVLAGTTQRALERHYWPLPERFSE